MFDIVIVNNDRLYKRRNGTRAFIVLPNGNEEHWNYLLEKDYVLEDRHSDWKQGELFFFLTLAS